MHTHVTICMCMFIHTHVTICMCMFIHTHTDTLTHTHVFAHYTNTIESLWTDRHAIKNA